MKVFFLCVVFSSAWCGGERRTRIHGASSSFAWGRVVVVVVVVVYAGGVAASLGGWLPSSTVACASRRSSAYPFV